MYNGIKIIFGHERVPEKLNTFLILSWVVWKYTCDKTDTGYKYFFQIFLNLLPSLAAAKLAEFVLISASPANRTTLPLTHPEKFNSHPFLLEKAI